MERRLLRAKEICCRVQQITEKSVTLLLYVTSRAGQNMLDEVYGALNWKREHKIIDGSMFCRISVWNPELKEWVSKEDVGTESYTEKEKGKASDSFKRACVNFGIGRELYSAPFIKIQVPDVNIKEKNGKYLTYDKFSVKLITYNSCGEIDALEIINQDKKTVFKKWPAQKIDKIKLGILEKKIKEVNVPIEKIYDMCSISNLKDMETDDFDKVLKRLNASK